MLSLCKTMHTLLGFPDLDPDDRRGQPPPPRHPSPRRYRSIPAPDPSSGLRILAGVEASIASRPSSPNVLESSVVAKRAPSPPPAPAYPDRGSGQVAPVGIYKLDYGRGELCTESLGAESCVGAMSKEEEGVMTGRGSSWGWKRGATTRGRWREERKRLPPLLSWLDGGRRSRFLRAEREEGRFRLTEVQIERPPELLRASRCDGRLRLDLIVVSDDDDEEVVEEGMEEDEEEEKTSREEEEEIPGGGSEREVRMLPATRCQDAVSGDGIAMWLDHRRFVTTA